MAAKKKALPRRSEQDDLAERYPGSREIDDAGDWMEWASPGQEIVGVYKGTESFRNGFKTTMQTEDGIVVFSTPKLLKSKLAGVEIGQQVAIIYTGEGKDVGKGNKLKEFRVFVG